MSTQVLAAAANERAVTLQAAVHVGGRPAKVLLLLGSLDGGGAERVAINLVRRCAGHGLDLRLGVLRREGAFLHDLPQDSVVALARPIEGLRGWLSSPEAICAMITAAHPDVVMSFGMGVDALTALAMRRIKGRRPAWIVRADSNQDAELADLQVGRIVRFLADRGVRHVQRSADAVVAVSDDLARVIDRRAFGGVRRTTVIHNPLDLHQVHRQAGEPLGVTPIRPFIVAAGRLVRQKGFDLLLDAFERSRAAAGMELVVLGEGPLEDELRAQAQRLGVASRVTFLRFTSNPWAWFARAQLFVLSSRWEGFGNVICEAQAAGAPVLAADCDFGPREQITHGVSGWLCRPEDPAALAEGMDHLLGDGKLRARLAHEGRRSAARFAAERVATQYSQLFCDLAGVDSRHVNGANRKFA